MAITPPSLFSVYLDSDGPIADFEHDLNASGLTPDVFKHLPGVYLWLPITEGAAQGISRLKILDDLGLIRVWIATKTPSNSPYAYTEKVLWYHKNFPWLEDRVILTHDKSVLGRKGDYLLDDRPHKANADKFHGTFVYFNPSTPNEMWESFVNVITEDCASRDPKRIKHKSA